MKSPIEHRKFEQIILALGILVAVVAGLSSSMADSNTQADLNNKAIVVKPAQVTEQSKQETSAENKTCKYLPNRLTIN